MVRRLNIVLGYATMQLKKKGKKAKPLTSLFFFFSGKRLELGRKSFSSFSERFDRTRNCTPGTKAKDGDTGRATRRFTARRAQTGREDKCASWCADGRCPGDTCSDGYRKRQNGSPFQRHPLTRFRGIYSFAPANVSARRHPNRAHVAAALSRYNSAGD